MNSSLKLFFCVLTLTIFTNQIYSQEKNFTIKGFIKDSKSGEILLGSNIILYETKIDSNNMIAGTSSNNHGYFAIPNLSKGQYFLVVSNLGYKPNIEELNVTTSNGSVNLTVLMNSTDIELNEIVISDKKDENNNISQFDISPTVLQQLPSMSGEVDLFRTLQTVPGVKTSTELSRGIYVRGGSADQTLTLVDGVMVYNPTHMGNFASTFNSNAIQNIKLLKGAFPAQYGGRLSSVLDVKLRSGTKEKDKAKIGLGVVNAFGMVEGPLTPKSTYMVSGRIMYYDKFQEKFNKTGTTPRYNFKDLNTKLTYNLSDDDFISLSGMFTIDELYNPSNSNAVEYDIGWENKTITLNWLRVGEGSLFLNNSFSYVNYSTSSLIQDQIGFGNSDDYFTSSNLDDLILKTSAELHLTENNVVKLGGDINVHLYNLIYTDIYSTQIEDDPRSNTEIFATEASMFIQNEWQISKSFFTNYGLRLYYFDKTKYANLEPRLSFNYQINDFLKIKSAFAIAHQFLHLIVRNDISLPTDLWYPSTKNINPSKSVQYVLGLESQFHNSEYLISLEGYYKDMKNIYEFKDGESVGINNELENLFTKGKGEAYGIEFFANKRSGNIYGWIGYTLSWTRRQFDDLNIGQIFYPRYDKRHDISLVLTYLLNNDISMSASWVYSSGQGYTMPTSQYLFNPPGLKTDSKIQYLYTSRNAYRMPAYHKLDLNFSYSTNLFKLPVQFYINLLNVYNQKNAFAYYITPDEIESSENTVKMKQITLFPFIPTFGITMEL